MRTFKALAIVVAVVGSTSLVLAQNGPPTPPQGPAVSTTGLGQSIHKKKSHHKLYMSTKTSKKKLHMTTTPSKT
jgi:hypothetical protein